MDLGRIGIWTFQLDLVPSAQARQHARELEELGYGALWIPEAVGREPYVSSTLLLSGTERLVVATGIASIWGHDAMTTAAAQRTIAEAFPDRFLLGLGVSHQPMVEGFRHQRYDKPYSTMKDYLDAMDGALFVAAQPTVEPQRVLAALGPRMLHLAAERAAGAHPYFQTPEHTAFAREALGDGPLLAVEQAVVLETDPTRAREVARAHTGIYTGLPNYANNLRRFGFGDDDFAGAGSDRLVDAVVARGDLDAIGARVRAQFDAGADHVCVQVIPAEPNAVPVDEWRRLAPVLLGS